MRLLSVWSLASVLQALPAVSATPYPFGAARHDFTNVAIRAADVVAELGPQLSPNASIVTQDEPEFGDLTARFSVFRKPTFMAIVNPGVESDVAIIVKYANSVNLPFLAVNRGHGMTETQGRLQHGLEINVNTLQGMEIDEEAMTVWLQGGAWSEGIIWDLWDAGYVTTTGSCGCVGVLGPGLGGGLGRYMGFYGLVLDSFTEFNMVLADGSEITVTPDINPDLWWAVRGAGHNFGIVTSFRKEIHAKPNDTWYYITYIFTQDKLEDVVAASNQMNDLGRQPREIVSGVFYSWAPEVDSTSPAVFMTFQYAGVRADAEPFFAPFDALEPASRQDGSAPYPELFAMTGSGAEDPLCTVKGQRIVQYPLGLLEYNVTTEREVYEYFRTFTVENPRYNRSTIVLETYSVIGMQAVPEEDSAYAHRADNLLVSTNIQYDDDPALDDDAIDFARQTRQLWQNGQPGRRETAYVNYAFGDETMEQMYGYEPWRQERLRAAKQKYDPDNKFSFYNPITFN
ncbi:hypothetical protein FQN54_001604 [Arachnomyces sp. PD_36]|nr:hypothetical protein FQN54_001604 [Arachnomyces sp. PD_36]